MSTPSAPETPSSIVISRLGGTKAVADRLGVHPSTVSCWRKRGLPPAYCLPLSRMAADLSVQISLEYLAELAADEEVRT